MKQNHAFGRKQVRTAFLMALGLSVSIGCGSRQVHAKDLNSSAATEAEAGLSVNETPENTLSAVPQAPASDEAASASESETEELNTLQPESNEVPDTVPAEVFSVASLNESDAAAPPSNDTENPSVTSDDSENEGIVDTAPNGNDSDIESNAYAAEDDPEADAEEPEEETYLSVMDGTDFAPVYNFLYYKNRYSDLAAAFGDDQTAMLRHFLKYGMKEQRQASEDFDEISYRLAYQDLRRAYGRDYEKYYYHYLKWGINEGRVTTDVTVLQNPVTVQDGTDYSLVYDYDYYTQNNPDVARYYGQDDIGVLSHFVKYGMKEQRQAISSFNEKSYRYTYTDLRLAYGSDYAKYYEHYIKYGNKENRKTTGTTDFTPITKLNGTDYSLVYDFNYYVSRYSDLQKFRDDDAGAIRHFVKYGMKDERQAISSFDEKSYRRAYQDLRIAYEDNYAKYYEHYIKYGYKEKRTATTGVTTLRNPVTKLDGKDYSKDYEYFSYLAENPDVAKKYGENDVAVLRDYVSNLIPKEAKKILDVARSWMGYNEKDGSFKEIIDVYNSYPPARSFLTMKYSYEWCAAFVTACAIKADLTNIIPSSPQCKRMVDLFKKIDGWDENDARVPNPGDIIMYDWQDSGKGDCTGWPDHVGIVESVKDGIITVIEGNHDEAVGRRKIAVNGKFIRGYCLPDYK